MVKLKQKDEGAGRRYRRLNKKEVVQSKNNRTGIVFSRRSF